MSHDLSAYARVAPHRSNTRCFCSASNEAMICAPWARRPWRTASPAGRKRKICDAAARLGRQKTSSLQAGTVWAKDHLCNMVPIRVLTSRRMPAEIRPVPANHDIIWLAGMIFSMSTNIVSAAIHEAADEKKNLRPSNSRRKRSRAGHSCGMLRGHRCESPLPLDEQKRCLTLCEASPFQRRSENQDGATKEIAGTRHHGVSRAKRSRAPLTHRATRRQAAAFRHILLLRPTSNSAQWH